MLELERRRPSPGNSHSSAVSCAGSGDNACVCVSACAGAGILALAAALLRHQRAAKATLVTETLRQRAAGAPLDDEQRHCVLKQLRSSLDIGAREAAVAEVDDFVVGTLGEQEETGLARLYTQKARASGSTRDRGVMVAAMPAKDATLKAALEAAAAAREDGCVHRAEFMALLSLASVMYPNWSRTTRPPHFNEAVVVVFSSLDGDSDAKLSCQEWLGFYNMAHAFGLVPPAPEDLAKPAQWHEEQALSLFREMETPNGELELSDFAAWCRRHLNRERLFSEYTAGSASRGV